jgi:hypothetical protein
MRKRILNFYPALLKKKVNTMFPLASLETLILKIVLKAASNFSSFFLRSYSPTFSMQCIRTIVLYIVHVYSIYGRLSKQCLESQAAYETIFRESQAAIGKPEQAF